jgi:DNA-binding NarL/FixJ family response regulator
MGAAPATEPPRLRARSTAVVESDDAAARRDAIRWLGAAGFEVGDAADVVVLLALGSASERVDRLRTTVARHPAARVVASMPADAGGAALRRALRTGVRGVVLDGDVPSALVPTVQAVLAGQLVVPPVLRRELAPPALSHREKEILRLVVDGYTNRQIADALYVAESTVKTHLSSAFGKLDARSRAEAAALILDPETGFGPAILNVSADERRTAA